MARWSGKTCWDYITNLCLGLLSQVQKLINKLILSASQLIFQQLLHLSFLISGKKTFQIEKS
jgi:flagellar biosynthesis/type III secretory pathway chaperone